MNRGERYKLTIERPAAGGRMIARHEGAIVFVSGAIPGEVVEAEVEKVQRGTAWASTKQVLEASPDRVTGAPDGACGGSVLAHIAYERQRQIKSEIITDAFRRVGRIALEKEADAELEPFRSRMPDAAYRQSRHQAVQRLVRQHLGIPSF
jgi:23S rRNA (uracil1939-C5)-methyltransferase